MYFYNTRLWQWIIYGLSKSEEVFPNYGVLTENLIYVFPFLFQLVTQMLMAYLARLSAIAGNKINCGPALTWMEVKYKARVISSPWQQRKPQRCSLPFQEELSSFQTRGCH